MESKDKQAYHRLAEAFAKAAKGGIGIDRET